MITIFEADKIKREDIFARNEPAAEVSGTVREIINNVRINGDKALSGYLEKFDKVKLSDFKVSKEEIKMSAKKVEPEFLDILKEAEAFLSTISEVSVATAEAVIKYNELSSRFPEILGKWLYYSRGEYDDYNIIEDLQLEDCSDVAIEKVIAVRDALNELIETHSVYTELLNK